MILMAITTLYPGTNAAQPGWSHLRNSRQFAPKEMNVKNIPMSRMAPLTSNPKIEIAFMVDSVAFTLLTKTPDKGCLFGVLLNSESITYNAKIVDELSFLV